VRRKIYLRIDAPPEFARNSASVCLRATCGTYDPMKNEEWLGDYGAQGMFSSAKHHDHDPLTQTERKRWLPGTLLESETVRIRRVFGVYRPCQPPSAGNWRYKPFIGHEVIANPTALRHITKGLIAT
jgi:hypothetical protein